MELSDQTDVQITLCKHADIPADPKAPLTGSVQFYQQKAYNQHTEQPIEDLNSGQLTSHDSDECTRCLQQILFEMDLQDDRPWSGRIDRLADYFNYDLNERSFREYVRNQIKLRFERRSRTALGSSSAAALVQQQPGGPLQQPGGGAGYLSNTSKREHANFPGYGRGGGGGGGGQRGGKDQLVQHHPPSWGGSNMMGSDGGGLPPGGPPSLGGDHLQQGDHLLQHGGNKPHGSPQQSFSNPPQQMDWYGGKGKGKDDSGKPAAENDTIYAIGFPKTWSKEDMQSYFAQFGIVMNCHLMQAQQGSGQRASGIINYMTVPMAREAIAKANGTVLEGGDGIMEVRFKFHGGKGGKGKGFGKKGKESSSKDDHGPY